MITGVYKPTEGNVIFNDKSIIGLKPYEIAANGIARTFQNIRLFTSLSVSDNVRVALNNKGVNNLTNSILQFKNCLLYTSPSPRDRTRSRMPSSAWKKKTTRHTYIISLVTYII